jgi:hypothetical protein
LQEALVVIATLDAVVQLGEIMPLLERFIAAMFA